jgi:4-amino-4-deoxy-L-arabinose transferase-like glycosyltransferase
MRYDSQDVKNKQVINFLVEDRYRWMRHSALLLGFLVLLNMAGFSEQFRGVYKYYSLLSAYLVFILMFYINMYLLVPAFFFKARYVLYLLLVLLLVIAGLNTIGFVMDNYLDPHRVIARQRQYNPFEGIMISVPVILVTTTVKLLQCWTKDNANG